MHRFEFELFGATVAIARLAADAAVPGWVRGEFVALTRTPAELSIVCDEAPIPAGVRREGGRRVLGIRGVVDFATIGVIAGLTAPLAARSISVFIVSTFDTDFLLVRQGNLAETRAVLESLGHCIVERG